MRRIAKLQSFSLSLILATYITGADENKQLQPLDEDFLEFIANMSEVDGEVLDTLDMLEIADNDMKPTTLLVNDLNGKKIPDKNADLNTINSASGENKL